MVFVPSSVHLLPILGFGILKKCPARNFNPSPYLQLCYSALKPIETSSARLNKSLSLSSFQEETEIPSSNTQKQAIQPLPTSAYIHLPFCRKRCFYCDFPIVALGMADSPQNPPSYQDPRMINYTDLICKEVTATPSSDCKAPLDTIFFGGGTPSLLPPPLLSTIIECLKTKFGLSPTVEISMEMDPGTFDGKSLTEFLNLGVNRVSLGVQAFQEDLLRSCGRAHGLKEVYEAIETIHSSGLQNWSMDLISSLPHQTTEVWERSLREAINSRPAHVSIYDLQVEEGTKFGLWYKPGQSPLPNEDNSVEFYRMASRLLGDADYEHYEISNYAKEGFKCRHNMVYWQNLPYYSFGLGSSSYVGGVRFSRPRRMKEYAAFVNGLMDAGGAQSTNGSIISDSRDMAMDTVMLSLRLARGLDIRMFSKVFGRSLGLSLCRALQPFVGSGHLIVLDEQRRPLSLEVYDLFCSDTGFQEILPQKIPHTSVAKENVGLSYRDGRVDLDTVEPSSASDVKTRVAFIRLSDPEGFLLSNELIATAFAAVFG